MKTTKLNTRETVLAKETKYGLNAVGYTNRTQASRKSFLLRAQGIDCDVINRGRQSKTCPLSFPITPQRAFLDTTQFHIILYPAKTFFTFLTYSLFKPSEFLPRVLVVNTIPIASLPIPSSFFHGFTEQADVLLDIVLLIYLHPNRQPRIYRTHLLSCAMWFCMYLHSNRAVCGVSLFSPRLNICMFRMCFSFYPLS